MAHLPLDFPPWSTVHRWFLRLSQAGVFERRAHALTLADRERVGRIACPTGWVVGRKRHALTDTDGRLLVAAVSPADLYDSHGTITLLRASRGLFPFLAHCFAGRAYRGERVGVATAITVEIVEPKGGSWRSRWGELRR